MDIFSTISQGEGYDLEFKRVHNEERIKYLKTVVAFANGKGGTILFGVANDGSVPGIDKRRVFAEMDGIADSICNACSPRVPIDIDIKDVGGIDVQINVFRNAANAGDEVNEGNREGRASARQKSTLIGTVDGTMDGTMALRIVGVLEKEPSITIDRLSAKLNVARRSLVRYMNILRESNQIKRIGGKRFGHWEVVQG